MNKLYRKGEKKMKKELEERFSTIYKGYELYAILLSHIPHYEYKEQPIELIYKDISK